MISMLHRFVYMHETCTRCMSSVCVAFRSFFFFFSVTPSVRLTLLVSSSLQSVCDDEDRSWTITHYRIRLTLLNRFHPPTALLPPAPKDANEFKEHLWRIWRAFTQLTAADCEEPRLFVCFVQASFASSPLHLDRDLTQTDNGMFNLCNLISIEQGLGKWVVKGLNKLNLVNGWKMENWFYMWVYLRPINKQLGLLW